MSDEARRARAAMRATTMVVRRTTLRSEDDPWPVFGADAISLATQLTVSCFDLARDATPAVPRDRMPVRFVRRAARA